MAKVDLHLHSDFSDGSDSVEVLIKKIIKANIKIFALTDHDTVEGVKQIIKFLPADIKFLPSTELTCESNNIKCHILGYNCNPNSQILLDLIEKGKKLRRKKLEVRINYLKETWGIIFEQKELDWLYSRASVVKTHLANLIVKRGLAPNNISAMKKYLDDCKVKNTKFSIEEAIFAIKESGGIPVWAHPLGGEGEVHIGGEIFLKNLKTMKTLGIKGLECYYSRYNFDEINFLINCANSNNLLISGGSDYHGKNKDIPLAKLNCENIFIDSEKLTILDFQI